MKVIKFVTVLLFITMILSLLPTHIFAVDTVKFSITPNVTEAHPGDEITYTVKMSAVQNLAGIKLKLVIPDGLTFIEGKEVDDIQEKLNSAKTEFITSTKIFIVGSSDYSSDTETTLMTFKCSVDEGITGEKEITCIIDEDDIFDTTDNMNNIPVNYLNLDSKVEITIPSTGIILNKKNLSLEEGTSEKLIATIAPEETTDTITWESSDKTRAIVDGNGKVTAVEKGTAVITAKTSSGKTAKCTVTVTESICKHLNLTTVLAKAATCIADGNNEYKVCEDCGKIFKTDGTTETTVEAEIIKALGHDFSISQRNETRYWNECSRCGIKVDEKTYIETIPVKETEEDNNDTSTPQTDDLSNITLWKIGMAVSGILYFIILVCKIKDSKRKKR